MALSMNKLIRFISFASLALHVSLSMASNLPDDINKVEQLNDLCRGGKGDGGVSASACSKRDKLMASLEKRGWCYGHDGQAGYEKTWERCQGGNVSRERISLYMPSNGKDGKTYRLDSIALVLYPERPCHLSEIPGYRMMRLATMSRAPMCYFLRPGNVTVMSPASLPSQFPEELFAVAILDEGTQKATVSHHGFDSELAAKRIIERERKSTIRQLPWAPLPPRDTIRQ